MVSAEQHHQPGAGSGFGVKAEGDSLGLKADPGVKVEGIKADAGFKLDPELKQVSEQPGRQAPAILGMVCALLWISSGMTLTAGQGKLDAQVIDSATVLQWLLRSPLPG